MLIDPFFLSRAVCHVAGGWLPRIPVYSQHQRLWIVPIEPSGKSLDGTGRWLHAANNDRSIAALKRVKPPQCVEVGNLDAARIDVWSEWPLRANM